ncbi:hypothetical protein D915_010358 [Fasciola hepatica]|uniref:Uncharacterized protein n=1 Tax=Fasciola hepatica TaxID=6192 RepID=A0A4E0RPG2_FASHE|nr:hypothetical protein D915_010358 [Fasciola hepatica]
MPVHLDKFLAYPSIGISCASLLFLFLFLVYRPRRNWDEWIGALVMTVLCAVLGVEILVTQKTSPTKDFDEHYFIVIILLQGFILTAYHCLLKWGMLRFYVRIARLHCTLLSKLCPKKKRKPKSAFGDRRVTEETSWDDSTLIAQILVIFHCPIFLSDYTTGHENLNKLVPCFPIMRDFTLLFSKTLVLTA